ncbi:MAG: hypothetical protein NY202_04790 [Mollicutes bacterium UO1]
MSAIKYSTNYGYLERAQEVASELKRKLQNSGLHDTPMLGVHEWSTDYKKFGKIITEPYVKNYLVSSSCSRSNDYSNFDGRIKTLDIIEVKKKHDTTEIEYDHVGVYLGNDKVFHFYDYRASDRYMKARVDDIGTFLGHTENTSRCGAIYVYHPMIPFKNYSKIARQIA